MWRQILFLCWLLPTCSLAEVWLGQVTHVSDGDTLWVKPEHGSAARKVRLLGLDAPELCQAGGVAARAALQGLVAGQPVQVKVNFQDTYGRDLAHLRVAGRDVGAALVSSGHAWSSRWHVASLLSTSSIQCRTCSTRRCHLTTFVACST